MLPKVNGRNSITGDLTKMRIGFLKNGISVGSGWTDIEFGNL